MKTSNQPLEMDWIRLTPSQPLSSLVICESIKMNAHDVKDILVKELEKEEKFDNWHGITRENLKHFLVEPFEVYVDPDDLETEPRNMWAVLTERKNPEEGYIIVYDPFDGSWGVAEHHKDGNYILVAGSDTFADALDSM